MKKVFLTIGIIFLLLFLIIINNKKDGHLICTYQLNQNTFSLQTKYQVTFKNKIVTNLTTTETITSNDKTILKQYQSQLESLYAKYKHLKYYDNSIKISAHKLVSITKINYQKIDTSKIIALDSSNKKLIKNGQIKLADLKKIYHDMGAKCKYH